MKLSFLLAILFGFTTASAIYGFIKGEFNWSLWVSMLIGGTISYFVVGFFSNKKK